MHAVTTALRAVRLFPLLALTGCASLGFGDDEAVAGEAERPRVEVVIDGLDDAQERNARAYLGLAEEPCDAPEWRIKRRFDRVERDIGRGLKALGHYRVRVDGEYDRGENCWQATLTVDPGDRVALRHVEVAITGEAAGDETFESLLAELPIRSGDPLDHGAYESTKRRLASLAAGRGYQQARLSRSELRVDPDAGIADALLTLDSGPRYRLGEITVEVEGLDEDLVRRIIEYEPDQPYDADRLHRINTALNDSGYFANVDVRADPDRAQDLTVPVTVSATTRKRHLYTAGAGFATDTGPRVRLGYENRRINKRGHRLTANLRAAPVKSDIVTEYRIPLGRPASEWLTFSAAASHEDTDSFESDSIRLGVRSTHLRGHWLETRFVELDREDFEVGATEDESTFLTPGLSYQRTHSDGSLRPDRGWRAFGEIRVGAESLLSDANIVRARVAFNWLRRLPWDGRILTRAEAGALLTNDFDVLPPSLRFFAGGDNSVRGYDFESLGPRDSTDQVIGGRYLGVVSLEYEHPIQGAWSGAVFVDAGNAFDNDLDEGVKVGVGAGIRWQSPVGPIRIDLAHPLDDDDEDAFVRLHLRIGPDL